MAHQPRKVYKGLRAQRIRALQRRLQMIRTMDSAEQTRADQMEVEPDLFIDGTRMQAAFARLEEQCTDLLAFKR